MDKTALNKQIGSEIRKAREHLDYTQEQLAEMVGKTPQFISDLERAVVGCSVKTLRDLCVALELSSDQVLFGKPSSTLAGYVNNLGELDDEEVSLASNIMKDLLALYKTGNKEK